MINSTREWDWMDDDCRIQKDIELSLIEELEGWGFDMDSLRESEGAFSSLDRRSPRAFSTNVSNDPPTNHAKDSSEWCYYAGMPAPSAYMEE